MSMFRKSLVVVVVVVGGGGGGGRGTLNIFFRGGGVCRSSLKILTRS